jgi:hypothetical protein
MREQALFAGNEIYLNLRRRIKHVAFSVSRRWVTCRSVCVEKWRKEESVKIIKLRIYLLSQVFRPIAPQIPASGKFHAEWIKI